jgi:hypothetical protein
MTLAEVQLLVAHARNEANHPSFKVSATSVLPRKLLNGVPGLFSTVSCAEEVRSPANPTLLKVCLYRSKATQVEQYSRLVFDSQSMFSVSSFCVGKSVCSPMTEILGMGDMILRLSGGVENRRVLQCASQKLPSSDVS